VTEPPPPDDIDPFDEAGYLRLHPGLVGAMMRGELTDPRSHYLHHGRAEGRRPNDVDPGFYLAAYPDVADDLGRPPTDADAAPHYLALGRARGYLPNAAAPRAVNGAAPASPFGGFWTDQANALDLIQGRRDLGWLDDGQAAALRRFALEGGLEIGTPMDGDRLRETALFVDQIFTGRFPEMLFAPHPLGEPGEAWRPELVARPIAALDPHMFSRALRTTLLAPAVTDLLALIFEAPAQLTTSRAFLRQEATPDRDAAWIGHSLPSRFAAVTFFLDDTGEGTEAARLAIWPGSHRLPDVLWSDAHVSWSEARRARAPNLASAQTRREERINALPRERAPRVLTPSAGTRFLRHANLIHGEGMPEPPARQRTLTAWYCPSFVMPLPQEATRARRHARDGVRFSSGVYPAMDPRD
jgi:hypothetical protein